MVEPSLRRGLLPVYRRTQVRETSTAPAANQRPQWPESSHHLRVRNDQLLLLLLSFVLLVTIGLLAAEAAPVTTVLVSGGLPPTTIPPPTTNLIPLLPTVPPPQMPPWYRCVDAQVLLNSSTPLIPGSLAIPTSGTVMERCLFKPSDGTELHGRLLTVSVWGSVSNSNSSMLNNASGLAAPRTMSSVGASSPFFSAQFTTFTRMVVQIDGLLPSQVPPPQPISTTPTSANAAATNPLLTTLGSGGRGSLFPIYCRQHQNGSGWTSSSSSNASSNARTPTNSSASPTSSSSRSRSAEDDNDALFISGTSGPLYHYANGTATGSSAERSTKAAAARHFASFLSSFAPINITIVSCTFSNAWLHIRGAFPPGSRIVIANNTGTRTAATATESDATLSVRTNAVLVTEWLLLAAASTVFSILNNTFTASSNEYPMPMLHWFGPQIVDGAVLNISDNVLVVKGATTGGSHFLMGHYGPALALSGAGSRYIIQRNAFSAAATGTARPVMAIFAQSANVSVLCGALLVISDNTFVLRGDSVIVVALDIDAEGAPVVVAGGGASVAMLRNTVRFTPGGSALSPSRDNVFFYSSAGFRLVEAIAVVVVVEVVDASKSSLLPPVRVVQQGLVTVDDWTRAGCVTIHNSSSNISTTSRQGDFFFFDGVVEGGGAGNTSNNNQSLMIFLQCPVTVRAVYERDDDGGGASLRVEGNTVRSAGGTGPATALIPETTIAVLVDIDGAEGLSIMTLSRQRQRQRQPLTQTLQGNVSSTSLLQQGCFPSSLSTSSSSAPVVSSAPPLLLVSIADNVMNITCSDNNGGVTVPAGSLQRYALMNTTFINFFAVNDTTTTTNATIAYPAVTYSYSVSILPSSAGGDCVVMPLRLRLNTNNTDNNSSSSACQNDANTNATIPSSSSYSSASSVRLEVSRNVVAGMGWWMPTRPTGGPPPPATTLVAVRGALHTTSASANSWRGRVSSSGLVPTTPSVWNLASSSSAPTGSSGPGHPSGYVMYSSAVSGVVFCGNILATGLPGTPYYVTVWLEDSLRHGDALVRSLTNHNLPAAIGAAPPISSDDGLFMLTAILSSNASSSTASATRLLNGANQLDGATAFLTAEVVTAPPSWWKGFPSALVLLQQSWSATTFIESPQQQSVVSTGGGGGGRTLFANPLTTLPTAAQSTTVLLSSLQGFVGICRRESSGSGTVSDSISQSFVASPSENSHRHSASLSRSLASSSMRSTPTIAPSTSTSTQSVSVSSQVSVQQTQVVAASRSASNTLAAEGPPPPPGANASRTPSPLLLLPIVPADVVMPAEPFRAGDGLTVSLAVGTSVAAAADLQALSVLHVSPCSQARQRAGPGAYRTLSPAALSDSCSGVLGGQVLLLAAAVGLSVFAVSLLVVVKRVSFLQACAMLRCPSIALSVAAMVLNGLLVCGAELAGGGVGVPALLAAVAIPAAFPLLSWAFGTREYHLLPPLAAGPGAGWVKRQLCVILAVAMPRGDWGEDPARTAWARALSSVVGPWRLPHPLWSLTPFAGVVALVPVVTASGALCTPLHGLSAALHGAAAIAVVVIRPRRVPLADILHGLSLAVNGAIVAATAVQLQAHDSADATAVDAGGDAVVGLANSLTALTMLRAVVLLLAFLYEPIHAWSCYTTASSTTTTPTTTTTSQPQPSSPALDHQGQRPAVVSVPLMQLREDEEEDRTLIFTQQNGAEDDGQNGSGRSGQQELDGDDENSPKNKKMKKRDAGASTDVQPLRRGGQTSDGALNRDVTTTIALDSLDGSHEKRSSCEDGNAPPLSPLKASNRTAQGGVHEDDDRRGNTHMQTLYPPGGTVVGGGRQLVWRFVGRWPRAQAQTAVDFSSLLGPVLVFPPSAADTPATDNRSDRPATRVADPQDIRPLLSPPAPPSPPHPLSEALSMSYASSSFSDQPEVLDLLSSEEMTDIDDHDRPSPQQHVTTIHSWEREDQEGTLEDVPGDGSPRTRSRTSSRPFFEWSGAGLSATPTPPSHEARSSSWERSPQERLDLYCGHTLSWRRLSKT